MKKISLSLILDSILLCFTFYVLSFVILNYFADRKVSYVWAGVITLILTMFCIKFLIKRNCELKLKKRDEKVYENTLYAFNFMDEKETANLIEKALLQKGDDISDTAVFTKFNFSELNRCDIVKFYNLSTDKNKIIIYCEKFDKEVGDFASRFTKRIILKDGKELFLLLKETNLLPKLTDLPIKKPKASFNILIKKRAKTFLGFGIFFLISSFFVKFKIYYLISSTAMLILFVLCTLFGKEQT